ncbi:MAG: hypothetical protein ACREUQ_04830 [Burkholderiales bacterium]
MTQRSLSRVPVVVLWALGLAFAAQVLVRASEPRPSAVAAQLPPPPSASALRLAAIGEPIALAQTLVLYLQAFDTQPGISIPFRDLDYDRIELWLERIVSLDPQGQYPLLLASQVYSQVPNVDKQRQMLRFVYRQFRRDPVHRWRWLAHVAIMAKHRLHDLPLALALAQAIAREADDPAVPNWAKQMHVFLLEDMGEYESAKILLGGLLASDSIDEAHERHFLMERLNALKNAENSTGLSKRRHSGATGAADPGRPPRPPN